MHECHCQGPPSELPPVTDRFLIFEAEAGRDILLGRTGEHMVRKIRFDISGWRSAFGDGGVQLAAKRGGREAPYLCVVEQDGDDVFWPVTAADVAVPGHGSCELRYYVGGQKVKAMAFRTVTMGSGIGGPCGPPSGNPNQGSLEKMMRLGADTERNAERAETAAMVAQQQAERAAEKASEAVLKAEEALETASNVLKQAESVEQKAQEAAASAETAWQAASSAQEQAAASAKMAGNAEASAQAAQKAAVEAQTLVGELEAVTWPTDDDIQQIWDSTVPDENTKTDEESGT